MKKILIVALLISGIVNAQESGISSKKNEFRVDVISAIVFKKISVSYERFLGNNFSTGINVGYTNSDKVKKDFEEGYINNMSKYELNPYFRYSLSKSASRYYFAEIFASYNGGDFKEIIRLTDDNNIGYYATKVSKYTDVALGGSVGYKMYFNESIAMEVLVGYGYNLTNTEKSPDKISRVGINIGYRF
ncbi:MAG: DUF3575 domain-containing protein [Flavobacteriaceae bacterium]